MQANWGCHFEIFGGLGCFYGHYSFTALMYKNYIFGIVNWELQYFFCLLNYILKFQYFGRAKFLHIAIHVGKIFIPNL